MPKPTYTSSALTLTLIAIISVGPVLPHVAHAEMPPVPRAVNGVSYGAAAPESQAPAVTSDLANRVYSVGTETVMLPKGKIIRLRVLNDISSSFVREGESFAAYVDEPILGPMGETVVPRGSLLRGRVEDVKPSRFFGKGGSFRMDFDHITLPNGEIHPISIKLANVNQVDSTVRNDGQIYEDPGYGAKFAKTIDHSGYLLSGITRKGYEAGKDAGGKALGAVTGTFSAIGGVVAATGYTLGKSVYHAVAKGQPADLNKDDAIYTELLEDTAVPIM